MIQWFKDVTADSIVFKGFMGLMVLSFGIWGIGDVITPGVDPNVAIQGARFEVRATELQRQFNVQIDRLRESLGADSASDPSLKKMVLDNTVQEMSQTAVTNMAALELGITVSRDQVRDRIMAQSDFKDETGSFSQMRLNDLLNQNQLTESMFAKLVEDDLRERTFLAPVSDSAVAPKALVEKLFAYRSETRVADTLLVSADAMKAPDAPTEEQLKKAYDSNIASFTAPEYRKVSAIILSRVDLVPPESIDDATVRAYYDENVKTFRTAEMRKISQLIFETKEQAEAARALMSPGDSLIKIAAKAKISAPIDLGERPITDPVLMPFGDAAKLAPGDISQPVQTDLGWHLLEVMTIIPEQTTPFEEVRAKVRKTIADEKSTDALYSATEKLEDEVAAGTPLAEIAKTLGGRFVSFDALDRQGRNPSGLTTLDTALNGVKQDKFLTLAFGTDAGTESRLMDFEGGYYILKVDAITPPAPKPFDSVKSEVTKIWQNQARVLAAKEVAEKIAADLSPTTTFTSLADKDKRLSYAKVGPLTRFGESLTRDYVVDSKRIGPDMLTQLFKAKAGDMIVSPVLSGYIVARVKEVIAAKPEGDLAKALSDMEGATRQAVAQDILAQFSAALNQRYPVTLNTKLISEIGGVAQ